MTTFIIIAAMLVLVALAFVLLPLWRDSRRTALALLLVLPILVAGLYALKGNPAAIDARPITAEEQVNRALAELETATAENPANLEAWVVLARARMKLQQYSSARDAYAKATALAPDEASLMVEYAEAQMRAENQPRFPPAAVQLLERALALQPENQRALFFMGMHQFQGDEPAKAARTWEKLLPLLDAKTAAALLPQINQARSQAQLPALETSAVEAGPTLRVIVAIDPSLASSVPAGAVMFVFARDESGAGPPFAAKRLPVANFPMSVELSDADSLMPTLKLSSQTRVRLIARISASGTAQPATGDIEAEAVLLDVKDGASATLTLSKILP